MSSFVYLYISVTQIKLGHKERIWQESVAHRHAIFRPYMTVMTCNKCFYWCQWLQEAFLEVYVLLSIPIRWPWKVNLSPATNKSDYVPMFSYVLLQSFPRHLASRYPHVRKYLILPPPLAYWDQIPVNQFKNFFLLLSFCQILTLLNALKILVSFFLLVFSVAPLTKLQCCKVGESRRNLVLNIYDVEGSDTTSS